jgi:hypothetical protein
MSKKAGKRTSISDLLKREICAFHKDNMLRTQAEIAAHFNAKYDLNIDRTTISKIINKKDKWLHDEGGSKTVFKHRRVKFPLLEEAMSIWIDQMTSKGVILTEALITEKAELFAKLLEVPEDELSFSNGWIFKFKLRNDLRAYRLHGEANSAPLQTLPIQRQKLREILSRYDPDNIYNADETGLFFRMMPNQTLAKRASAGKKLVSNF